ncbi:MAG: pitrilysin family protein [Bacteroidales bacterium]|jgi:predicted Zn-dependent peptidase|nr:pitrilysin family protein [Bacteroidales bacterium]MDD3330646.1 pitrilysin family protein [Bacteroidales bacterium]MDD4045007.1 pitrilysin family protein [Bacteroidales bacterium]MDX9889578.1 pitrilysin family protein [Bacteroidales bacterium]NLO42727.1 insulinase family protein [Bacteroidales bacterium]
MQSDKSTYSASFFLSKLEIIPSSSFVLSNDIPVLMIHNDDYRLIRLDICLSSLHDSSFRPLSAISTAHTLFKGTYGHNQKEISEIIDFYGAYYDLSVEKDYTTFSFYFPKKASRNIFSLLQEVFSMPNFPEEEIQLFKEKQKQELAIKLGRNSYIGFKSFFQTLFEGHPYGRYPEYESYDAIERKDICDFFASFYHAANMRIFMAGDIDNALISLLTKTFETIPKGVLPVFNSPIPMLKTPQHKIISKNDSLQSNIIIGKPLFNFAHEDWKKFSVLNLVLGGYFGSRLMSEIREKSGLAYGIYSYVSSFKETGVFYITAQVNGDKTHQALEEIYKVLDDMLTTPITHQELNLVKNFYYGSLLRDFDGLFSVLDRYIDISDYGMSIEFWHELLESIQQTSSDDIIRLAKNYLQTSSMVEVVVGNK